MSYQVLARKWRPKQFSELVRGEDSRKQFFNRIIEVVTLLGGACGDVL